MLDFFTVHDFAHGMDNYRFEELQIYGAAHFAILTEPHNKDSELFFLYMIGDRTGTVHLGENQVSHKRSEFNVFILTSRVR